MRHKATRSKLLESVYLYQLQNSIVAPIQNHVVEKMRLNDDEVDYLV